MGSETAQWYTQKLYCDPEHPNRPDGSCGRVSGGGASGLRFFNSPCAAALAVQQLTADCEIEVIDYCRSQAQLTGGLTSDTLAAFLAEPRPPWSKVRWISVCGGVSGSVLRALSAAYNMQPLALNDALAFNRVKLDQYPEHLYFTTYVYDLKAKRGIDKRSFRRRRTASRSRHGASAKGQGPSSSFASLNAGDIDVETGLGAESGNDGAPFDGENRKGGNGGAAGAWRRWATRLGLAGRGRGRGEGGGGARGRARGGGSSSSDDDDRAVAYGIESTTSSSGADSSDEELAFYERASATPLTRQSGHAPHSGERFLEAAAAEGGALGDAGFAGGGATIAASRRQARIPAERQLFVTRSGGAAAASAPVAAAAASPLRGVGRSGGLRMLGTGPVVRASGAQYRLRMPLQAPCFAALMGGGHSIGRRVIVEQMSFICCPGGVVISLHAGTGPAVVSPIAARLREGQALLLESEDPGVLLYALLQCSLAYSSPVIEAFAARVAKLDMQVVQGHCHIGQSRALHLLCTDLSSMQRSFALIHQTLASLVDRAAAANARPSPGDRSGSGDTTGSGTTGSGSSGRGPGGGNVASPGRSVLLSDLAVQYLSDTMDQTATCEQDLAALLEHSRRLGDMVFNSVSHRNETATITLAVVGMIFLPLTFLTGVYGMNFTNMPILEDPNGFHSFWIMSVAAVLIAFLSLFWMRVLKAPRWLRRWRRRRQQRRQQRRAGLR